LAHGASIDAQSSQFDYTGLRPKPGSVGMNFPRGGFSPLLFAARQGKLEAAKALIEAGADVNLADPDGVTPLQIAIINFHFDVAGLLIESGADVNASEGKGRSPLYAAVEMRTLDVSNRPSPKVEDKLSALDIIKMLLAKGASPHASLIKVIPARAVLDGADGAMGAGATPFLRAARGSDIEAMKLLVAAGADPRATTQDGAGAMHLAAGLSWRDGKTRASAEESVAAVKYLGSLGLSISEVTSRSGETPLHGAAGRGADGLVQALVDLGADVNALDKSKRTPLDMANGAGGPANQVRVTHDSTAALLAKLGGKSGQALAPQTTAQAK
jgi:ankyrin repeat protein